MDTNKKNKKEERAYSSEGTKPIRAFATKPSRGHQEANASDQNVHAAFPILILRPVMATPSLTRLSPSYEQALRLIDEAHAEDPNKVDEPGESKNEAYELHYARKMTKWLAIRCPNASQTLQVACRAQHFRR